jgi:hypothetical protein
MARVAQLVFLLALAGAGALRVDFSDREWKERPVNVC